MSIWEVSFAANLHPPGEGPQAAGRLGLGLPRGMDRSGKGQGQGQVTLDHPRQPRSPVTPVGDPVPLSVPDSLILKVLSQRLCQQDCVERGWVLHGFPRDLDQAHLLDTMGHKPNR